MIVDANTEALQTRARLWNLMLGGTDAREDERNLLTRLRSIVPGIDWLARNERDFVTRWWRYVTGERHIEQVVHLGAPLPAGLPPHLRLAAPGRVVYVEGDTLLHRTGHAWMAENSVAVVHADPLDVPAMVDAIGPYIDWLKPVAVIAPTVLSWVDDERARTWVTSVVAELPPESVLTTTHFFDPDQPESVVPIEQLQHAVMFAGAGSARFRRRTDIEALFPGLTLEPPGVTPAMGWWPNGPLLREPMLVDQLLAVAVVAVARSSP